MKIEMPGKLARYAVIAAVAGISGLTPLAAISGQAYSQATLDLELNGTGATAWSIANIKPGDSGIQSVELRNAGDIDGRVSIWISDITESDHGGDGNRLDDYLLFDISCSSLTDYIDLPARIDQLPQSAQDKSLSINPLVAGENVTLVWEWLFQETGQPQDNAQGDSLSFTINYLLEEIPSSSGGGSGGGATGPSGPGPGWLKINVLGHTTYARINEEGTLWQSYTATDAGGKNSLQFSAGTAVIAPGGVNPKIIEMRISQEPPAAPDGIEIIGPVYEIIGYDESSFHCSVSFSPPVILSLYYADNVSTSDNNSINIGSYAAADGWITPESSSNATSTPGTVSVLITQTSTFAVLSTPAAPPSSGPAAEPETTPSAPDASQPEPPKPDAPTPEPASPETTPVLFQAPAHFELAGLVIEPAQVGPGEPVTISGFLRNTGELQGSYTLELGINGKTEQSREINIAGGESAQVVFSVVRNVPGTYTARLGMLSGEFTVLAPALSDSGSEIPWAVLTVTFTATGLLVYLVLIKFKIIQPMAKPPLKK